MITDLNHLNLSVTNLNRSFSFYTDILGFKPLARWKRGAYLLAGDLWLCLSLNPDCDRQLFPDYTHYAFSLNKYIIRRSPKTQ
ncbi:MAG: VOC family protein [Pleurocapsa sp. MO_226.B13]|nr:VOC family protein [Pleurocapsa sp. MO_226.B13]